MSWKLCLDPLLLGNLILFMNILYSPKLRTKTYQYTYINIVKECLNN